MNNYKTLILPTMATGIVVTVFASDRRCSRTPSPIFG